MARCVLSFPGLSCPFLFCPVLSFELTYVQIAHTWGPIFSVKSIEIRSKIIIFIKILITEVKKNESVISSNLVCKDGTGRFTTAPSKALPDEVWIRNPSFCFFQVFIFIYGFPAKETCTFLAYKKQWRNYQKSENFSSEERGGIFHSFDPINIPRVPVGIKHGFIKNINILCILEFSWQSFKGYRCKSCIPIFK